MFETGIYWVDRPNWPETLCIDQADLNPTEISCLYLLSTRIIGVCCHAHLEGNFEFFKKQKTYFNFSVLSLISLWTFDLDPLEMCCFLL